MASTNARRQGQPRIGGGMTELCSSACYRCADIGRALKSSAHVLCFRMREPLERPDEVHRVVAGLFSALISAGSLLSCWQRPPLFEAAEPHTTHGPRQEGILLAWAGVCLAVGSLEVELAEAAESGMPLDNCGRLMS